MIEYKSLAPNFMEGLLGMLDGRCLDGDCYLLAIALHRSLG
jgi:hypothetical protein